MAYIKNITFENYKALSDFVISFHETNILIGPNNCGKSTIIGAFRLLDLGLKKARNKRAEFIKKEYGEIGYGFNIDESDASISLENVATDYNQNSSCITFILSNSNKLILYFPERNSCIFTWENNGLPICNPSRFREAFPIDIQVVPVLGPIEHEEPILTDETIRKGISSHRSSRHFRNYWYRNHEGWDKYQELIEKTWPGMSIKKPELIDNELKMFCSENRIDREMFWAGFGFQIWCQLLSHLSRATADSTVIIDEPEIYLHPDVQRQLVGIIKDIGCYSIIATHSVEIISEADPSELLLIDKNNQNARRLKDINSVQKAIELIGSTHNITLAQLARTRRMVFTEGQNDGKLIRKIARRLGYSEIASGNDLTWFESGGFTSWESIKAFADVIEKTIDEKLAICTIYDRDYFCDEELLEIKNTLEKSGVLVIFHSVKEIENYLLSPKYIEKALKSLDERITELYIKEMINIISNEMKAEIQGQYLGKRINYFKNGREDISTISKDTLLIFEQKWNNFEERLKIIPGKIVLQKLREIIQSEFQISISDSKIIESINKDIINKDLSDLILSIEEFRKTTLK